MYFRVFRKAEGIGRGARPARAMVGKLKPARVPSVTVLLCCVTKGLSGKNKMNYLDWSFLSSSFISTFFSPRRKLWAHT